MKTSQNLQTGIERYSASLDKVVSKFGDIDHYENEINVKLEKGTKTLRTKFLETLKDIGRELKDHILKPFTLIFSAAFVIDATKAALEHIKAIRNLSFRMGEAGKSAGQLSSAMFNVANKLGLSTDASLEFVSGLKEMRVASKNVDEMATATGRFARITGTSNEEAIALTGNLMRMGGLGVKATTSILTTMAHTQREVGLTGAEMGQLVESSTEYTRQLANMGKSAGQIESFNKGVVRLAGSFAKVGLNIEDATQMLDRLMDPGQIQDNALLFAKLGMSIQDAVQGNIDPEKMQSGLKQMGQQIKEMSGPAGAALAKQMGMTYKQALAYSQLDLATGAKKGQKDLKGMYDETRSLQENVMSLWNRVHTAFESLIVKAVPLLEKAFSWLSDPAHLKMIIMGAIGLFILGIILIRRRFLAIATDFGKTVGTATTEALVMAQRKSQTIAAMRPGNRGPISGLMARVEGGAGYAAAKETQNVFGAIAQTNVFGLVAKMATDTEKWYHYIALGSRPLSAMGVLTEERNKRLKDEIGFLGQETSIMTETYRSQLKSFDIQKEAYAVRIRDLSVMEKRTNEQDWELKRLTTLTDKLLPKQSRLYLEIGRMTDLEEKRSQRRINKMNPAYLAQLNKELIDRKQILAAENISLRTHIDDLETQTKMVRLERDALQARQKALYLAKDTSGEYQKVVKRLQEIEAEDKLIQNTTTAENERLSQQLKEVTSIEKQMAQISASGKGGGGVPVVMSNLHRFLEFSKSAFNAVGNKITGVFEKAGNSLKAVGSVLAQRLNPINIAKSLIGKNREDREGAGSLGNTLGKLAGIALKIFLALGLMAPIQKIIGMLLKAFKPVVDSLVAILFPALVKILKGIMPFIQVLITFLLPPLLKVLGLLLIVIGYLIKAIGFVIGIFSKGKLYDAIDGMADAMIQSGKDIMNSNNKLNTTLGSTNNVLENKSGVAGIVSTVRGSPGVVKVRAGTEGGEEPSSPLDYLQEIAANTAHTAAATEVSATQQDTYNKNMQKALLTGRSGGAAGINAIMLQHLAGQAAVSAATGGPYNPSTPIGQALNFGK